MNDQILAIEKQLEDAFGDLPIPSDDRIVSDNSGYDLECNQIRAKFRGRHWRDLSAEDLIEEPEALAFFTPEAFRFFLPAFVRVSLLEPERADLIPDHVLWSFARPKDREWWEQRKLALLEAARAHEIPEKVVLDLAPTDGPELDAACKERVEALTDSQKRAIISFVSFLKSHRSEDFRLGELDLVEQSLRI